ncbi:hypothetical protein UFOVP909_103 [uncultured Caudovirales phage]|uniref:Uncharacterized protein n=1 Tax=uncultured Caudovirales phage TaxID=2100421 RepID=A0A6J5RM99_9CAUD|nr:hypothetical protein UFOVP909_103 [uncultured Caudovirales phage]CAB4182187.1 hypothetical protein UFOVP1066_168 [uncultured Caudovirales phage]CAB4198600.1 hypothetical protein UFOVP1315_169 [uncultured Caudovirales phage]CAB4211523.1 hypothetical protein UFOVP1421_130 [uncultured Caudovirales phage]CAB5238636.1 hypothetical protein UFOVP1525_140 [uncultured Caudovirales phage]
MTLNEKYSDLQVQKMKLDKFFSMFLEKFERKMDPDSTDTPVWKLYKNKLKEYEKVSHELRTTQYWIDKE